MKRSMLVLGLLLLIARSAGSDAISPSDRERFAAAATRIRQAGLAELHAFDLRI